MSSMLSDMWNMCFSFFFFLRSVFHAKVRGRALRISRHETERAEGVLSS